MTTHNHDHEIHQYAPHEHHDHHGHHHAPTNFNRAFAIGITLNVLFVAIEAFYGWQVDSLALLADAGHNLSDVLGLVLAWGGVLAAKVNSGARYTYGWKRATILAAFANALLLLVAMGSLAWEAIGRLSAVPTSTPGITIIAVAGIGIIVNTATALLFMHGSKHDLNIRGAFLHMAGDALVSLGVVITGALALWYGWHWLDPVASLLIAIVILVSTWSLFRESLHLLFDGVPANIDIASIRGYFEALPEVSDVHDLHIWAMGTAHTALTVHLVVSEKVGDTFLNALTHHLHMHYGVEHSTIQIEATPCGHGCEQ